MAHARLNAAERAGLLDAIHAAILRGGSTDDHPRLLFADQLAAIDRHLDEMIDLVRHTSAARVETYTAEMVQEVCAGCSQQDVSGYCVRRADHTCPLFVYVRPIVNVIAAYLSRTGDAGFARSHPAADAAEASIEEVRMIRRIIIAVNDSKSSEHALKVGGDLAVSTGAKVRLVHAVFPLLLVDVDVAQLAPSGEALVTAAEVLLAEHRRTLPASLSVDTRVVQGRPADAIVDAAREFGADLIVIGDHRPHSIAAFLLGNTADAVVRHAPCPVLVARPTHWPTPTEAGEAIAR